jgi:rSAM/selenodomain-associated transferase 2
MFSVIVPVLDEEARIGACLEALTAARGAQELEVLVVDGGSTDGTVERAQAVPGVTVLAGPRGRARQLNRGASRARGDVLLFLHADSRLAPGALDAAAAALARDPAAPGGAFRMAVDAPGLAFRVVEWLSHARLRATGVICGDQGLFVRAAAFRALGGFPDQPLMEDVAFSRRMATLGAPLILAATPIVSSARRFQVDGVARRTLGNWAISLAYWAGASPTWLKRFYPDERTAAA